MTTSNSISALHFDSHLPSTYQQFHRETFKINGTRTSVWSFRISESSYETHLIETLMIRLLNGFGESLQSVSQIDPKITITFPVDEIQIRIETHIKTIQEQLELAPSAELKPMLNFDWDKSLPHMIQKVQRSAAQWFERNYDDIFHDKKALKTSPEAFSMRKLELRAQLFGYYLTQCGFIQSEEPVEFSEQDCKTFDIRNRECLRHPQAMSCFEFALMKAKETRAKDAIFYEKDLPLSLEHFYIGLTQWGYQQVDTPETGDLVLYLTEAGITHAGVYLFSGKVESKFGFKMIYSYQHALTEIPLIYGHSLIFMHKPNALI